MTDRGAVTNSIIRALIAALRAEGWEIRSPRAAKEKRPPQFWKDADIEFVRAWWPNPTISTEAICARVGRSLEAVKHMAAKIGVRRPVGRPAKKPHENPALRKSTEFVAENPPSCLEMSPEILSSLPSLTGCCWPDPTLAEATEIVSPRVSAHDHAPKMADRDPLPAPRKAKRGGSDRTGALMGDPGFKNRREAECQYSKDGSGLS